MSSLKCRSCDRKETRGIRRYQASLLLGSRRLGEQPDSPCHYQSANKILFSSYFQNIGAVDIEAINVRSDVRVRKYELSARIL